METQDYRVGDYLMMGAAGKIEFLCRVHKEEISLWDDDGDDNEFYNDYHAVQEELLDHPEMLDCEDVLHIMKIFKMVFENCLYYGKDRIVFYLRHLQEVPLNGRFHGWHFPVQWLLAEESFPALKEAVLEQAPEVQKLVSEILDGIDTDQVEKEELKTAMTCDQ